MKYDYENSTYEERAYIESDAEVERVINESENKMLLKVATRMVEKHIEHGTEYEYLYDEFNERKLEEEEDFDYELDYYSNNTGCILELCENALERGNEFYKDRVINLIKRSTVLQNDIEFLTKLYEISLDYMVVIDENKRMEVEKEVAKKMLEKKLENMYSYTISDELSTMIEPKKFIDISPEELELMEKYSLIDEEVINKLKKYLDEVKEDCYDPNYVRFCEQGWVYDVIPKCLYKYFENDEEFITKYKLINFNESLKKDKAFAIKILAKNPYLISEFDDEVRCDKDIILKCFEFGENDDEPGQKNAGLLEFVINYLATADDEHKKLLLDADIILKGLEIEPEPGPRSECSAHADYLNMLDWRIFANKKFVNGVRQSELIRKKATPDFWKEFEEAVTLVESIKEEELHEELRGGAGEFMVKEILKMLEKDKTVATHIGDDLDNKSAIYALEEYAKVEGILDFDDKLNIVRLPLGQIQEGMVNIGVGGRVGTRFDDDTIVIDGDIEKGLPSTSYMLSKLGIYVPDQVIQFADNENSGQSAIELLNLDGEQIFKLAEDGLLDSILPISEKIKEALGDNFSPEQIKDVARQINEQGRIIDSEKVDKIREYLKTCVNYYTWAMDKIGIKIDKEDLKDLIENINITLWNNENTTGTFQVNQVDDYFKIVLNNFEKNGMERNNLLMLHEMTHLSSEFNNKLFRQDNQKLINKFNEYDAIKSMNNDKTFSLTGFDVREGLIAIDEVLAQWCAERGNEAIPKIGSGTIKNRSVQGNKKTELHEEEHVVLGTTLKAKTDFSNKDIYAPLEEYVEDLAIKMGFENLEQFAKQLVSGEKNLFDYINNENIKAIGCIGILCEGIYQQNGFEDFKLPASDIGNAVKYLETIKNKTEEVNWIVLEDAGAGSCRIEEYTGGAYQEYTGRHESVVGEYETYEEAEQHVNRYYEDIHEWLVIRERARYYVGEYTGGGYQNYTGPHGEIVGHYETYEEAEAALKEFQDADHGYLVLSSRWTGELYVKEYTGGPYFEYTGVDNTYEGFFKTEGEAEAYIGALEGTTPVNKIKEATEDVCISEIQNVITAIAEEVEHDKKLAHKENEEKSEKSLDERIKRIKDKGTILLSFFSIG